jgi:aprataxin
VLQAATRGERFCSTVCACFLVSLCKGALQFSSYPQDFNSAGLKHKKHWNSFTAAGFFLDAAWVLQELRGPTGMLEYSPQEKEALLKGDLRCHRCGAAQSNMPRLKQHVAGCGAPLPLEHLY